MKASDAAMLVFSFFVFFSRPELNVLEFDLKKISEDSLMATRGKVLWQCTDVLVGD